MSASPTLFLSHGSPMMAMQPDATSALFVELGSALPRQRAIVVVSAHHMTRAPEVGAAEQPETIHDFGGFPRALYEMQYPARGDATLSKLVSDSLTRAGLQATVNPRRGLDHGAWVPLRYIYPDADVPVVPVAVQPERDARHHFAIGQALASLGDDVLILASGNLTHNLYEINPRAREGEAAPYARAFQTWFHEHLTQGALDAVLDWEHGAPEAARAHPTDEHLLPLFVALGAAAGANGRMPSVARLHDVITLGVLAMDAYAFDQDPAKLERLSSALGKVH